MFSILPALFSSATEGRWTPLSSEVSVLAHRNDPFGDKRKNTGDRATCNNTGAVMSCTCWRWWSWWQMGRLEHGLLHLFGIESAVPDPQLCSREHVLYGQTVRGKMMNMPVSSDVAGINDALKSGTSSRVPKGTRDGCRYLGSVEVQVIVLLVSSQILVTVIGCRSHQHHPVAVVLAAGIKTHHHAIPLEDLPIKGLKEAKKTPKVVTVTFTNSEQNRASRIHRVAPSEGILLHSPDAGLF